ncbi:helix-turn-helix transcriptional regulator [Oceanidesulfovibrio indonesiensis]|uniref:helix-turn-helix transcriptional regulator n=1 Tax=Oceanidesulfovibrio indonesiensis TaxID=54767 RepID=UPI0034D32355
MEQGNCPLWSLKYLSPVQVEAVYGIPVKTLEDWRRRGIGPKFSRISKRMVKYSRLDVEAWFRDREVLTADQPTRLQVAS